MNYKTITFLLAIWTTSLFGQVDFTANDEVRPYATPFLFGVNPGYYDGWDDESLADIVAGNPQYNLRGAGVETQRLVFPHSFLDNWGYDIRVDELEYFESLGLKEHTVTIGFPADQERDSTNFCPDHQSELFANLYLPIWVNGAINPENYFANYVYQTATTYKSLIKFYEIWNEPDFDYSGNGFKDFGEPGNWFENIPAPCDVKIRAPIFQYIRMLRIAYDVVKTVDPDAYVAVGGLGYVSFLDLILRFTDNPDEGKISADFPLTGGAYFDVMSYHSYPHFDGALRDWNNDLNDFEYFRHSDAAVQGLIDKKNGYADLLKSYGYDDDQFPKKLFINTESNLPRVAFDDYIGSDAAQTNFIMKLQVACRKNKIQQFHIFKTGESRTEDNMSNSFHAMGFFKDLEETPPYEQIENECVLASATTTHFLKNKKINHEMTETMNLPPAIDGGFFCDNNDCVVVLWAKTKTDQSEGSSAMYSYPSGMEISEVERFEWDYMDQSNMTVSGPQNISLSGRPSFFNLKYLSNTNNVLNASIRLFPNKIKSGEFLNIEGRTPASIEFMNLDGQVISSVQLEQNQSKIQIPFHLPAQLYLLKLAFGSETVTRKIVVVE